MVQMVVVIQRKKARLPDIWGTGWMWLVGAYKIFIRAAIHYNVLNSKCFA
jgi:hypothetical protein